MLELLRVAMWPVAFLGAAWLATRAWTKRSEKLTAIEMGTTLNRNRIQRVDERVDILASTFDGFRVELTRSYADQGRKLRELESLVKPEPTGKPLQPRRSA